MLFAVGIYYIIFLEVYLKGRGKLANGDNWFLIKFNYNIWIEHFKRICTYHIILVQRGIHYLFTVVVLEDCLNNTHISTTKLQ